MPDTLAELRKLAEKVNFEAAFSVEVLDDSDDIRVFVRLRCKKGAVPVESINGYGVAFKAAAYALPALLAVAEAVQQAERDEPCQLASLDAGQAIYAALRALDVKGAPDA